MGSKVLMAILVTIVIAVTLAMHAAAAKQKINIIVTKHVYSVFFRNLLLWGGD